MEPVEFGPAPHKLSGPLVANLYFAANGVVLWHIGSSVSERVLSVSFFVFFALGAALCIRHWMDRSPRLRIDDAGVWDRSVRTGPVPWSEITGAYVTSWFGKEFVCLTVRNPEIWITRQPWHLQACMKINRRLGLSEFVINLSLLPVDAELVPEIIDRHMTAFKKA